MPGQPRRRGAPLPRRAPLSGDDRVPAPMYADTSRRPQPGSMALADAVVDCAFYADGARHGGRLDVEDALQRVDGHGDGFVWIGLHDPAPEVVEALGLRFDLPPMAVEDAVHAHQRPKLEVMGDSLFVIFKTARYVDAEELVDIGELMLFLGPGYVVTVRHGQAGPLTGIREELEAHPDLLELGPSAVLYAVADRVVDDYAVVLAGLEEDVEQVEDQVFSGTTANPAERIYRLKREVLEFKRAIMPLAAPMDLLAGGAVAPIEPRTAEYFRDVSDHLVRDAEHVQSLNELLTSVLNANVAQLSIRDNADMRKISAWLAIIAVPTMVFGIYGMNFDTMPELRWDLGYPLVLAMVLAVCGTLYGRFKRAGWL